MGKKFTSENFEAEVLKSEVPVMVDFYADWCGPCKMMGPIVEELAAEFEGKVKIGKLNVDESSDIAMNYGVMSIPTLIIFKGGQVIRKEVGMQTKKLLISDLNQVL
ncbi:MAG: thioredoxin [Clostridium sp.]